MNDAIQDTQGLVWAFRFDANGCAAPLLPDAALEAVRAGEAWVWLHFDLGDQRARAALHSLPIPAEALDVVTGAEERPRLDTFTDAAGSVVAGIAMDFERDEEPDPRKMVPWRFCMLPGAFISVRRRPLLTMQRLNFDIIAGRRFVGVLQLFDGIVHGHIAALAAVSRDLTARLDAVEDGLLEGQDVGDYEQLGQVRRGATRLFRQTLPLNAMLAHLLGERPDWFTEDAAEDCSHVQQRIASVAADLTAMQERARALQDEVSSRQAEQTNRRLMLLSVFSAVLLPPTLISGVFGMNVEGLPWKDSQMGFFYTIALMSASIAALLVVLRRLRLL